MWKVTDGIGREKTAGLEVGGRKVALMVGERTRDGWRVVGRGVAVADGVRNGRIVSVPRVGKSIEAAAAMVEDAFGVGLPPVLVGISGNHFCSRSVEGFVSLPHREMRSDDVRRLKEVVLSGIDRRNDMIHLLPLEYEMDDENSGLANPLGKSGKKLAGEFLMLSASAAHRNSLQSARRRAGLEIKGMAPSCLAGVKSVLTPDEAEQGVVLIDCGKDVTDMAFCYRQRVFHLESMDYGAGRVTAEMSRKLQTSANEIERILAGPYRQKNAELQVRTYGPHGTHLLVRQEVKSLLRKCLLAYLREVNRHIDRSFSRNILLMGAVLSGGGALFPEIGRLAELVLAMPVQTRDAGFLSVKDDKQESPAGPAWATAIGLAELALFGNDDTKGDLAWL
ncbi:MAG: cell division protein FtsA [Desulfobulbaceae bacterium]|nr:cell division protein FtsA [Desulfobulbaceae bacterium]HIJ79386.1 cell division protein FtsA [Deltaproteobacteria bacterium]